MNTDDFIQEVFESVLNMTSEELDALYEETKHIKYNSIPDDMRAVLRNVIPEGFSLAKAEVLSNIYDAPDGPVPPLFRAVVQSSDGARYVAIWLEDENEPDRVTWLVDFGKEFVERLQSNPAR